MPEYNKSRWRPRYARAVRTEEPGEIGKRVDLPSVVDLQVPIYLPYA